MNIAPTAIVTPEPPAIPVAQVLSVANLILSSLCMFAPLTCSTQAVPEAQVQDPASLSRWFIGQVSGVHIAYFLGAQFGEIRGLAIASC